MEHARAPLFSVSFAFALGVLLGFIGLVSLPGALLGFGSIGLGWYLLRRRSGVSLAVFYLLIISGGLAYTLLYLAQIAGDDLRLLPDEKKTFQLSGGGSSWRSLPR